MCGFVALYNVDGRPVDRGVLVRMTERQRHRGPDDEGYASFALRPDSDIAHFSKEQRGPKTNHEGAFGFNRLSIRDLSPSGHQPMSTRDGRVLMVFNGEIYNADGFRSELARRGFELQGTSDSEVLLYLYRAYGIQETLRRVNGMFALCIADLDRGRLVLARDHLGVKPLYYWANGSVFAAASEAKSLLAHPEFTARLDESNLAEHLAFRSCAGDRHLLAGVKQVEPGEWLELGEGRTRRSHYWKPKTSGEWRGSFDDAVEAVEAAVDASVRRQLVSDVPVGCQFSAGVDSSLVSALANRHQTKGRYKTFSIVVDSPRYDESRWIEQGERLLSVEGHRFRFGSEEFSTRLERATWHLDEPLDHMNSIGIMLLAERSRAHVTVLLSGEGADETFGGYSRFHRVLFRPALAPLAPLLARIPHVGRKLAGFDSTRGADDRDWFIRASSPIGPAHVKSLTGRDGYESAVEVRRQMFPAEGDLIARCRAYELRTFLVGLLKRQDKMTMAHGIENRVPLLDHELVDLVCGMPSAFCVDRRPRRPEHATKRVLKAVAARHFPDAYVYRRKEGFGMPIRSYLASPAVRPLVDDVLVSAKKRGLFNAGTMRSWYEHLDEPLHTEAFWIALTFELWARQFLDGAPVELAA